MATDREESIEAAARALLATLDDAALDGDSIPETSRTFDCGWGVVEAIEALRSALAQPAAPSVIVPPDVSRTAQQAYLDGYAARARMELYEAVDDAQGEPK